MNVLPGMMVVPRGDSGRSALWSSPAWCNDPQWLQDVFVDDMLLIISIVLTSGRFGSAFVVSSRTGSFGFISAERLKDAF